ncbi:MAG: hypothetical protein QW733_04870 [Desulfurococcaceae archaeon]
MKILFDRDSLKLGVSSYLTSSGVLDEACALGLEFIRVMGVCDDTSIHVYVHISIDTNDDKPQCEVRVLGITVELPKTREVNNEVLSFFKYSSTIIEEDSVVKFYIDPPYTLGVFYMTCKGKEVRWIGHSYAEPEDLVHFQRGA